MAHAGVYPESNGRRCTVRPQRHGTCTTKNTATTLLLHTRACYRVNETPMVETPMVVASSIAIMTPGVLNGSRVKTYHYSVLFVLGWSVGRSTAAVANRRTQRVSFIRLRCNLVMTCRRLFSTTRIFSYSFCDACLPESGPKWPAAFGT